MSSKLFYDVARNSIIGGYLIQPFNGFIIQYAYLVSFVGAIFFGISQFMTTQNYNNFQPLAIILNSQWLPFINLYFTGCAYFSLLHFFNKDELNLPIKDYFYEKVK